MIRHLVQMGTFVQVVDAGSFAAAARALDCNPTLPSKHVAQLEAELGTRLLLRHPRRLELTPAGEALLGHCRVALREVAAARASIRPLQSAPLGRLRVSAPPGLVAGVVIPWLPEFQGRFPGVELDIVADNRFVDLAEEGFDLALRVTASPQDQLVARKLADMQLEVCASPAYLERHGTPTHPLELAAHDCLQFSVSGPLAHTVFERAGERLEVPLRGSVRINHAEPLHALALGGMGVALLSSHLVRADIRAGRLVKLLPEWKPVAQVALYAVYLPNRFATPKLRAFIDFLLEKFSRGRR